MPPRQVEESKHSVAILAQVILSFDIMTSEIKVEPLDPAIATTGENPKPRLTFGTLASAMPETLVLDESDDCALQLVPNFIGWLPNFVTRRV